MAENTDPIDALLAMIQAQLLDVNTCIPGVIQAYEGGLARVLPVGKKRYADGDALPFPVIPNVRVCWPSFVGGAAGVKGPVSVGDPCLLVFSQQAVDGSDDRRVFDLQDAYAVMCNLGDTGPADSTNNADMTMYFGAAYIRLTKAGQLVIKAPGGVKVDTTTTDWTSTAGMTFTTPLMTVNGAATVANLFTYMAGMSGIGGAGSTDIAGNINHTSGTITSLGRKIDGNHTHNYDDDGAFETTSPPNA